MLSTNRDSRYRPVDSIDEDKVTFHLNHPLAGKSLTFNIKVMGISATATQQDAGYTWSHRSSGGCDCGDSGCC